MGDGADHRDKQKTKHWVHRPQEFSKRVQLDRLCRWGSSKTRFFCAYHRLTGVVNAPYVDWHIASQGGGITAPEAPWIDPAINLGNLGEWEKTRCLSNEA